MDRILAFIRLICRKILVENLSKIHLVFYLSYLKKSIFIYKIL